KIDTYEAKDMCSTYFNGKLSEILLNERLWIPKLTNGSDPTPVRIATDGSTDLNSNNNSAASIVFIDDDIVNGSADGLSFSWKIDRHNNHHAELAPICRAIYAVPLTNPLDIYTDSNNSIRNIHSF